MAVLLKFGSIIVVGRRKQIRVVEGIKEVGPERKRVIFQLPEMDREIALDGRIKVNLPRSVQRIAGYIAGHARRYDEMKRARWLGGAYGPAPNEFKTQLKFVIGARGNGAPI